MKRGIIGFHGQSNMEGFRSDPGLLPSSTKDSEIKFSYNRPQFGTTPGNYKTLQPCLVNDGGGNGFTDGVTVPDGYSSYGYGCEITCARSLHSTERPIAVVKRAQGETDLDTYWNPQPPGTGWNGYDNSSALVAYTTEMYNTLQAEGEDPYYLGMVWWQGENDAADATKASKYEYNLRRFIAFYRALTKRPDLPIVICLTTTGGYPYLSQVQVAQRKVVETTPNTRLYDPTGLPVYSDGIHFCQDAHVTSGNAIANLFKEMGV